MLINVYYFPKEWLKDLEEVLAKKIVDIEKMIEYPRDNSIFTEIVFECSDASMVLLLGYHICFNNLSNAIDKATPQMLENISKMVDSVTKISEN